MAFECAPASVIEIIDFIPGELRAVRFRLPDDVRLARRPGNAFWVRMIGAHTGKLEIRAYSFSDSTLASVFETVVDEIDGTPNVSRSFQRLHVGDAVEIRTHQKEGITQLFINPRRDLELEPDEKWRGKKFCFVAYGTGITPLLSTVRYVASFDFPCDVVFLVSAKKKPYLIFHEELVSLAERFRECFFYLPTLTREEHLPVGWQYETGRFVTRREGESLIDVSKLLKACPDLPERHLEFCGGKPGRTDLLDGLKQASITPLSFRSEVW